MSDVLNDIKTALDSAGDKIKDSGKGVWSWIKKSGGGVIGILAGITGFIVLIAMMAKYTAGPCAVGGTTSNENRYFKQCEMRVRIEGTKVLIDNDIITDENIKPMELLRFIESGATTAEEEKLIKAKEAKEIEKVKKKKHWWNK